MPLRPNPVRNVDYTKTLAHVLHRPAVLPVPSLGPRLLLGEQGARELAEADQRVAPAKLQAPRASIPAAAPRGCAEASAGARLTNHPLGEGAHQGAEPARGVGLQLRCRRT